MNLFHPNSDKNKFGYYQVGEYRTYSKYDAILAAKQSGQKVDWIFNDEVYSSQNWSIEPDKSLDELYRLRAEQIREKYDYIVLLFSGGADSHNVLMTFVNNNIHLDEVLTHHTLKGDNGDQDSFRNLEVFRSAVPIGKQLAEKYNIKHRVVDNTDLIMNFQKDHCESKFDYVYYGNFSSSINSIARSDLKSYIEDYRKLIEKGKRVCFIHPTDKPCLTFDNGKWWANFFDVTDHSVPANQQMYNRDDDHDEFFYWSPECPEIVIKQCHVLKNYLSNKSVTDNLLNHPKVNKWNFEYSNSHVVYQGIRLLNEQIKYIIYSNWSSDIFSNEKSPTGYLFTMVDSWFYKTNTEQSKIYANNVAKAFQDLGHSWFRWHDIDNTNIGYHKKIFSDIIYPNGHQFKKIIRRTEDGKYQFPSFFKSIYTRSYFLN